MGERDPEVEAMRKTFAAVKPLEPDAQERVVRWLAQKTGVTGLAKPPSRKPRLALADVVDFVRQHGRATTAEVAAAFGRWPNDYLYRANKRGLLRRVGHGVYEAAEREG